MRTADQLPSLLQEASKKELPYTDLLEDLLGRELAAKQERHTAMKTSMARFPFHKTLENFDFKFQPSMENRLEEKLKQLIQPKLLIIDEIGYLPLDRLGANLLFQLVSRRYERGSILITSNQSLAGVRSSATR